MRRVVLACLAVLAVTLPVTAQTTGTISGRVTDDQGAPLPGASVTLQGPALAVQRTVVTDPQGDYRFVALPAASGYWVKFSQAGFASAVKDGISVVSGHDTVVDAALQRSLPPYIRQLTPAQTIRLPQACAQPAGVSWDGRYLWVTDTHNGDVWRIDSREVGPEPAVAVPLGGLSPGPIAFDPQHQVLWIVDADGEPPPISTQPLPGPRARRIARVAVPSLGSGSTPAAAAGQMTYVPLTPLADPLPVSALAWDGSALWLATSGGLCACVYRIDQNTQGTVLFSFFPGCDPVGLAVDRDGMRLWLAAEVGSGWGPLLLGRRFVEDTASTGALEPFDRTQRFLVMPKSVRPRSIAAAGESVWVLDDQPMRPKQLLKFVVRTGDSW